MIIEDEVLLDFLEALEEFQFAADLFVTKLERSVPDAST